MKIIETATAPKPVGPYSQATQVGNILFCSGQIAIDPKDDSVSQGPVEQQAEQVLKNIGEVLKAAGLSYSNVAKTTIFLVDMADFAKVNEVYARYFKAPYPARSTIAVAGLPKGVRVEIEVTAVRP